MKVLLAVTGILFAVLAGAGLAPRAAAADPGTVDVTLTPSPLNTVMGERFTIRAQFVNSGATPTEPLVADLNVASLTGVYVDLEDWSASRTHDVAPIAPGGNASLSWDIQAVNAGSFDVYIVLLPNGPASAGTGPLVASPPVHVTVAGRRALNAGGALPIAVIVPVLLGLTAVGARYRLRRAT
jgi:hypothetical protein